ncbi:MAG: thioredoxin domain-containing protein [Flavobacteriia bacterium]|nr:thioredoxin domain-containing protein [Flavobacteriia bacterium]
MMKRTLLLLALFMSFLSPAQEINWEDWSPEVFERAKAEGKLILLHLEANWCHWCHVMEQETYANEEVASYVNENYIAIHADQDKNPVLGNRYRAYGWPAIILFNSDIKEVNKIAGYRSPSTFINILRNAIANPVALQAKTREYSENQSVSEQWQQRYVGTLDTVVGGYRSAQKYVDEALFDWSMLQPNSRVSNRWLEVSMRGSLELIDSEWGGIYQYSVHYGWTDPHYEKLVEKQARYIRLYAQWFQQTGDSTYLRAMLDVVKYTDEFLSAPDGRWFTAQDADLRKGVKGHDFFALDSAARFDVGMPAIDSNLYVEQNGTMITAYVYAWAATGNQAYLERARNAFSAMNQMKYDGLYSNDGDLLSLRDQLNVIEALYTLYNAENQSEYIVELKSLVDNTLDRFYVDGEFVPWIAEMGLEPEFDLELQCRTLGVLKSANSILDQERIEEVCQSVWSQLQSPDLLSTPYSMPEWKIAERMMEQEVGSLYIAGNEIERQKGRRVAILLPDRNHRIIETELDNPELESYSQVPGVYLCRDGRCQFPILF